MDNAEHGKKLPRGMWARILHPNITETDVVQLFKDQGVTIRSSQVAIKSGVGCIVSLDQENCFQVVSELLCETEVGGKRVVVARAPERIDRRDSAQPVRRYVEKRPSRLPLEPAISPEEQQKMTLQ